MALGYDGRLSSPELAAACIEGLTAAGLDVTSIGVAATPMLYFAVYHFDADAGIQITGSHNPPDYNGFKMMMGKKSFFGEEIQKLGAIAAKGDWESGQGKVEQKNILADYAARLLKDVKPGKKLKVAWDTRQRRGRRVDPRRRRQAARRAFRAERESRRHLPRRTIPIRRCPRTSSSSWPR